MLDLSQTYEGRVVAYPETGVSNGGVRVLIYGVTDGFKDSDQPIAYPRLTRTESVPVIGDYVQVSFPQGDFAFMTYDAGTNFGYRMSREYVAGYPNTVHVDAGISHVYDRTNGVYEEADPVSAYNRRVDATGVTDVTAPIGYSVVSGEETSSSRVVTEDSVNIMTGRPISQGSNFYKVPTFTRLETL